MQKNLGEISAERNESQSAFHTTCHQLWQHTQSVSACWLICLCYDRIPWQSLPCCHSVSLKCWKLVDTSKKANNRAPHRWVHCQLASVPTATTKMWVGFIPGRPMAAKFLLHSIQAIFDFCHIKDMKIFLHLSRCLMLLWLWALIMQ